LFRNNVGLGYQGEIIHRGDWFIQIKNPRRVYYGLHKGSADIIGWESVDITPEMVGKKIAVFLAIEVKSEKGKPTKEQQNFIEQVNKSGGIGIITNNVEDVINKLKGGCYE